jgi:hypothetical protein
LSNDTFQTTTGGAGYSVFPTTTTTSSSMQEKYVFKLSYWYIGAPDEVNGKVENEIPCIDLLEFTTYRKE